MKKLEQDIMSIILNEGQYSRVSFLESSDFNNYQEFNFKDCFSLIEQLKCNAIDIHIKMIKSPLKSILWLQSYPINSVVLCNLEKLCIYLIEIRFKKVFGVLLDDLILKSKSDIERSMIEEYQMEITRTDIFVLADSFMEYLGHHASDYSKSRVEAYLKWRDKRVSNIKNHLK